MAREEGRKSAFVHKISDFFRTHFPNIKIAAEAERDLLIERFANSSSFFNTHTLIAKLVGQSEFSLAQVEQLIEIPDSNNQVGLIVGDPDVHAFYAILLQQYADKIQKTAASKLAKIVARGKPSQQQDEEVPF
jgi:hypothetical protein